MERERNIKRAKEREKNEGRLGERTSLPSFFLALLLAFVFARAPLSERLEQAIVQSVSVEIYENRDKSRKSTKFGIHVLEDI